MHCFNCNKLLRDDEQFCENCGAPRPEMPKRMILSPENENRNTKITKILVPILVLAYILVLVLIVLGKISIVFGNSKINYISIGVDIMAVSVIMAVVLFGIKYLFPNDYFNNFMKKITPILVLLIAGPPILLMLYFALQVINCAQNFSDH